MVIALVGYAHGTSHFFHLMLPPLFPWLMRDFALSFTEVGAFMTLFFVVSGVGQALAGFVVDRYGAFKVLCGGITLLALSGLLLALAAGPLGLALAAGVAGLGNSVFHPADYSLLNRRVSPPRLGHAFSVHGLSGALGWAAGPALITAVASAAGWRAAGLVAAGLGAFAVVLLWSLRHVLSGALPQRAAQARPAQAQTSTLAFLRASVVWLAFAFFFLSTLAFGALQNFAPPVLQQTYGLTLALATTALSVYIVGSAAGILAGGFFAARDDGQARLIGVALTCGAALALVLASGLPPSWSVPGIMALMGFGVGFAGPSRDMLVRRAALGRVSGNAFGRVYGFVYSGLDVGLALAPIVFGRLMDAGRPGAVLVGVALALAVAIASAWQVGSRSRQAAAAT
jgi:MFS family permease